MSGTLKPLRMAVLAAAALGLVSITFSGEIAPAWCALSWAAWIFSIVSDRFPGFQAKVRHGETAAVAGMVGMIFLDFFAFRNSIFIAVTHFLLLFQIVKLVGEKARKDCLQIFLFSFFQVLAACTLSVDPWHAAVLLALIPTATAALFWNQIARESEIAGADPGAAAQRNYRRMAVMMCAGALPLNLLLTVAVFVIFPRLTLNAPLPGFSGHRMGYTDQVNLSQKGNLRQDDSVVLWLAFPKEEERLAWSGYLRGDVLSVFNGHDWSASPVNPSRIYIPDSNGVFSIGAPHRTAPLIHQAITLSDTSAGTLFAIGIPLRVVASLPALQAHEGGTLHWLTPLRRPLRYEIVSEPFSAGDVLAAHSELPRISLDRVRTLAAQVAGRGSPLVQARNIESYLRKNYRYSTNFGDRIVENPVDAFLFERREGSCGHFASAMALMLRLRHIPSRLVAGYLKGEWNKPAEAVVIRERDAHAWVEAYIAGQGWMSFDPSPRQVSGGESARASLFNRLGQYGDYFGFLWNRFVIQYDLYSQIKAFENLKGGSDRFGAALASWWSKTRFRYRRTPRPFAESAETGSKENPRRLWKEIVLFVLFAAAGFFIKHKRRAAQESGIPFYNRFLDRMARAGCPKLAWETGQEFAVRLAGLRPEGSAFAWQITKQYYDVRFKKELR